MIATPDSAEGRLEDLPLFRGLTPEELAKARALMREVVLEARTGDSNHCSSGISRGVPPLGIAPAPFGVYSEYPMIRPDPRLAVLLVALLHLLLPLSALAQGVLGGTIRNLGGGIPASTSLTIRVFPLDEPTNAAAFPGDVQYSNGTYSILLSRFPIGVRAGQTLHVKVRAIGSSDGADLDVLLVDTQSVHLGDLLLQPVTPAQLTVRSVQAPAFVLRGQKGVQVEASVENSGGEAGSLLGAHLLIGGVQSGLATGYAVTTAPGNLTELAATASTVLTFSVDVLSQAPLQTVTLDVRLDSVSPGTATTAAWQVAAPANIQLLRVETPGRVLQGQTRVPVAVSAVNTGTLEGSLANPVFRFSGAGVDRQPQYSVTLPVSNLTSLAGGQATTLNFLVAVAGDATTGPVNVDVAVDGAPQGSAQSSSWTVGAAGVVRLASLTAPTSVKQGQTAIEVTLLASNPGSLASPVTGLGLLLTRNGVDASADYSIVASGPQPTFLAVGQSAVVRFRIDVSPVAPTGRVRVDGRVDQSQEGVTQPGSWTVSRVNLCPTAVAGGDRSAVLESSGTAPIVRLSGHDSVDPDRPSTDAASGLLEFSWRLASAHSESGEDLSASTPFQGGSAATLRGAGDRNLVDPEVTLPASGDFTFGLIVRETGSAGAGNEGCSSPESFVTVRVRKSQNRPPAARALLLEPGALTPTASAALPLGLSPLSLQLVAQGVGGGRFDTETPDEAVSFRWSRVGSTGFAPGPSVEILNASSRVATVVVTAPGAYAFSVTVADDGRLEPGGAPSAGSRRRGYPSTPVSFTIRPANRGFPVIAPPSVSAPGVPVVNFSRPVVIPATATVAAGGFPAVELSATASASDPGSTLVYGWRQILGTGGAPAVPITTLPRGVARFWPQSSGLYRFEVTVSDGVLGASTELVVPVDDLRPGGRAGVIPAIGGVEGGAEPTSLPPVDTATDSAELVLDATGSTDRSSRYGRPAQTLSYLWTQLAGDQDLVFDSSSGRLRLLLPPGTSGEYRLALELDNGFDSLRQEVRFATTGGAGASATTTDPFPWPDSRGGSCGMTSGRSPGVADLALLLLPLGWVFLRLRAGGNYPTFHSAAS